MKLIAFSQVTGIVVVVDEFVKLWKILWQSQVFTIYKNIFASQFVNIYNLYGTLLS